MWIAVVKQRQGVLDEADALYRDALSQMKPESQEAATVAKLYSDFLRAQGRDEEAKELNSRTTIKKPAAKLADGVYRIGGDVTAPSLLQKVEPVYTDEARLAKLTGTAILSVEIGVDGLAHNAQILQGLGLGLDEKSIAAVSQWKFKPGSKNGQPVPVQATIEINWRLM
jgi:TonB family protein